MQLEPSDSDSDCGVSSLEGVLISHSNCECIETMFQVVGVGRRVKSEDDNEDAKGLQRKGAGVDNACSVLTCSLLIVELTLCIVACCMQHVHIHNI